MQQHNLTPDCFSDRRAILMQSLNEHQVEQITIGFDDRYFRNRVRSFQYTASIQFRLNTAKVFYDGRRMTLQRFLKDFVSEIGAQRIEGFGTVPGTFGKMVFTASGKIKVEAYLRALPEFEEFTV